MNYFEFERAIKYRDILENIVDSGIFTYEHEIAALNYAIFLIQKAIDGEAD